MGKTQRTFSVLLLALGSFPLVHGEEFPACPAYRVYNDARWGGDDYVDEYGLSIQFNAPNGCECVDGMYDLNCAFCETDEGCQTENSNHYCRKGMVYAAEDTYKAYRCRLFSTLESLFPNGKLSIYVDIEAKTAFMSVYNIDITEPIRGEHAVDCELSGCDIPAGGASGKCKQAICNCTQQCSDFTRSIVEGSVSGKPAEFRVTYRGDGEAHVEVAIEGAPFAIEAMCNASSCTHAATAPNAKVNSTDIDGFFNLGSEQNTSTTFAAAVLLVIVGVFAGMMILVGRPFVLTEQAPYGAKKAVDEGKSSNYIGRRAGRLDRITADTTIEGELSAPPNLCLEFRHIGKTVRLRPDAAKAAGQAEKMILNNISGKVESGTLMAIMGPSGSGKSSLLNVLAAVETQGVSRVSGQILLNGVVQKKGYRTQVAYVQQDDALYGTLTVRECLEYSALLRLPKHMKASEKQARVWQSLRALRVTDVADSRIGSTGGNGTAGISGGERKRVTIGMELIADAPVLVLDEPTSGLDAYGANQLVKLLSELSSDGNRIVILSVHQPSMKAFMEMDQVLLLGHGRTMYNGRPADVAEYLGDLGFPCPPMETIADHMLNIVSDSNNHDFLQTGDATAIKCTRLVLEETPEKHVNPTASLARSTYTEDYSDDNRSRWTEIKMTRGSRMNEIAVLFFRTARDIFRNKELFMMQMSISLALALFGGGIFNGVSNNLAGFQNRMGAFYFSLSFFAFASFSSMDIFVRERHIFVRETGSKYYTAFSYYLAKVVLDMFLLRVIPVAIFTFVFYFLMGLKNELQAFVTFLATIIIFNICAGIMSICISIATPTVGQANLIAAVWFLVMLLFGGFLVNIQSMSAWFAWLKYLSIFYYSFEILMTNELSGQVLSFDAPGYPSIPVYGEVFLKTIGMDAGNQTRDMACLCTLALGFGVVAYFLLLIQVPPSAAVLFNKMQKENKRLALKGLSLHHSSSGQFNPPQKSTGLQASQRDMTHPVIVAQSSTLTSNWEIMAKDP